ncbi:MAG: ABC transporter permease [Sneathiellaceae bacterium]
MSAGPLARMAGRRARTGLGLVTFALPLLFFVGLSLHAPDFLGFQNLANVNSQITALLIISLGQLLVALSAGVDLSVGSVLSLTSAILVSVDPGLAVPLALLAGLAVGLANGIGVAVFGVHPLVMTLAMMTFLQGLALLVSPVPGGDVPDFLEAMVKFDLAGIPGAFFWCLAAVLFMAVLLHRTRFGLRIFAIGAGSDAAALNGIAVVAPQIACYVICSLFAVLAGLFLSARVSTGDPTMGAPFALESVTAIALGGVQLAGGVGSVTGVIFGVITLGLMTNGMNLVGISPFIRAATTGLLLLLAISLQRRKAIGV